MHVAETSANEAVRRVPEAPRNRIHALLIEDNPGDARLIEIMLTDAESDAFEIEQADRLGAALERLSRGGVDVILSDLSLPDSRGLETFTRLHQASPRVPIIVLSGQSDTRLAVTAVHEGAQDFLVKGQVDGQLLARSIRYAIERKGMSEQLQRYADELRKKNAQLEADFNMAREIQQIFLPNEYPTFPHWETGERSALGFSHRYISAAAVGGDFFDFFAINDTACGVLICDVMGHGMRAALITAIMRGLIEELMPNASEPGEFITEINRSLRAILRQTREPFLATAFYGVVDVGAGELRFANAGHPSPFFLNWNTRSVETLKHYDKRHGPALGLFERTVYPTCRIPTAGRDRLFLFTDGVYEVKGPDEEEFGQERLLELVRSRMDLGTEQIFEAMLREARQFSGESEFEDDVCLAAVEIKKLLRPGA